MALSMNDSNRTLTRRWLRQNIVPYSNQDIVFNHVDALLTAHPTLRPKTEVYTFDDGRFQLMLCVHGLLPITYRRATYNIPVSIWLTHAYPSDAPIVYVVPTTDMLVKANKHIDVSGRCNFPYTQAWQTKSEGCNLVAMVDILTDAFSNQPPVYAKPQQPPVSPPPGPSSSSSSSSRPGSGIPDYARRPAPVIPTTSSPPPPLPPSHTRPHAQPPKPPVPPHPHGSPHRILDPPTYTVPPQQFASSSSSIPQYSPQPLVPPRQPSIPVLQTTSSSQHIQIAPVGPPPLQQYHPPQPQYQPITFQAQQPHQPGPPSHPAPQQPLSHPQQRLIPPQQQLPVPQPTRNYLEEDIEDVPTVSSRVSPPPRPPNPEILRLHHDVLTKINSEYNALEYALNTDLQRLRTAQTDLLNGEAAIHDEMGRLQAVKDVCTTVADRYRATVQAAESNLSELRRKGDPEVDELICSTSIVYNQMIDLVAEDNAIEDTIYHLHRGLNAGKLDLDKFLRITRALAEEQFMKRALAQKIISSVPSMGSWG